MAERISKELLQRGWKQRQWRWRVGLFGGLMAGFFITIYTFWGGRDIFMEQPLSFNHSGLEKKCGYCHHPFEGVKDSSCVYPCHSGPKAVESTIAYNNGVHYGGGKFANNDCLSCHPPECHSSSNLAPTSAVGENAGYIPCEPKKVANLILPKKMNIAACASCHPDGCKRSTRCVDCHHEHIDGMLLTVNRADEIYPARLVFPADLRRALESAHSVSAVALERIAPIAGKITPGADVAENLEALAPRMPSDNCIACHPGVLTRKAPTREEIENSRVPRTMFRHDSIGHRRYRSCGKCHLQSWLTESDPNENIFTMESCSAKCHYPDDCAGCHKFHDRAGSRGDRVDIPMKLKIYLESLVATPESVATPEAVATPEQTP